MQAILANRQAVPETLAQSYVNAEKGIENVAEALEGARQILMETLSENAPLLADCRQQIWAQGVIHAHVVAGKEKEAEKFKDYFDFREPLRKVPSHRILAMLRGRNENFLVLNLLPAEDEERGHASCI